METQAVQLKSLPKKLKISPNCMKSPKTDVFGHLSHRADHPSDFLCHLSRRADRPSDLFCHLSRRADCPADFLYPPTGRKTPPEDFLYAPTGRKNPPEDFLYPPTLINRNVQYLTALSFVHFIYLPICNPDGIVFLCVCSGYRSAIPMGL